MKAEEAPLPPSEHACDEVGKFLAAVPLFYGVIGNLISDERTKCNRGSLVKQGGEAGVGGHGRPLPPSRARSLEGYRDLVGSFGRELSGRSGCKSRVDRQARTYRPRADRRRGKSEGRLERVLCGNSVMWRPARFFGDLWARCCAGRHIICALQGSQELHEPWILAPRLLRFAILDLALHKCFGLHLQIDLGIHVGRAEGHMAQPGSNGVDVNAREQKMHRRRMPAMSQET